MAIASTDLLAVIFVNHLLILVVFRDCELGDGGAETEHCPQEVWWIRTQLNRPFKAWGGCGFLPLKEISPS